MELYHILMLLIILTITIYSINIIMKSYIYDNEYQERAIKLANKLCKKGGINFEDIKNACIKSGIRNATPLAYAIYHILSEDIKNEIETSSVCYCMKYAIIFGGLESAIWLDIQINKNRLSCLKIVNILDRWKIIYKPYNRNNIDIIKGSMGFEEFKKKIQEEYEKKKKYLNYTIS